MTHFALAPFAGVLEAARADLHDVAGAHEARVPLGQLQAQDVAVLGERRDRLAGQDDRAFLHGRLQNAACGGREHRALLHLLADDVAIALHRVQRALSHVERRFCGVDLDLGADAALLQFDRAVIVRLGLVALRLLRLDAGIDCLLLQDKLWISDDGDLGPCRDLLAFLDGEGGDRAADAGAGGEFMDGLDGADHRLLVGDVGEMDHERLGGPGVSREKQQGGRDR